MKSERDLFVAIDANAIIHRAFHAYPPSLSTSSGVGVNAVYGFTVMLLQILKQYDPKYIFCAFDTKAPTFRHAQFAEYKGTRKPTDETLIAQFPLVEEVLNAFNIPIVKKEGFEADDIIGTVASWVKDGKWSSYDFDLYLVTGDRDFLQLVGDNVYACLPAGGFNNLIVYDRAKVFEKYGYYPEQVVDYKGIVGDASDNIPGVKGVGEKSGVSLLEKYQNLEDIYKNLSSLPPRLQKLLGEGLEQAEFSRELATIKGDVDLDLKLEDCLLLDFDEAEVLEVFRKFEFKSLVSRIPKSINGNGGANGEQLGMFSQQEAVGEGVVSLVEWEEFEKLFSSARLVFAGYVSKDESISGSFCFGLIVDKSGELFGWSGEGFTKPLPRETYFYNLEDYVSHELRAGSTLDWVENVVDIKLLSHLLSSGKKSYDLSSLVFDFASRNAPQKLSRANISQVLEILPEVIDSLQEKVRSAVLSEYSKGWLERIFDRDVDTNIFYDVVREIENKVAVVLGKMENRGIAIDYEKLSDLEALLAKRIASVQEEIFSFIGHEFNLNSPKQLSDVLYTELALPEVSRGAKARSTREEILEQLVDLHPSISLILSYRELSKIHGTYVKPFIDLVKVAHNSGEETAIHTDFKLHGASSGRFASINPNMQNLPLRGEWGEKFREVFVARDGFKLVSADYSQIEFRVMADISGDEVLISDFNAKKDIHTATAARILNKKVEEVVPSERSLGKTMNFAILFGQTSYGLSRLLKVDSKIASGYIDEYFKNYAGVAKYIKNAEKMALDQGYVQSMLGRTRYISGLASRNFNIRAAAIREAINMPIQGGEADIMKLAMIEIDRVIDEKYSGQAFMLLQIHDELIFEVVEERVEEFERDISEIMKGVVQLKVPLDVNTGSGSNLAQLK